MLEGLEYAAMAGEAAEREAANCRHERSDKAAGSCPQHPSGDVDAAIFRSRLVDWAPPVISRLKRAAL